MFKPMKPAFWCALIIALATFLAACGTNANHSQTATAPTAPAASATATLPPCPKGFEDSVEIPEPDKTCAPVDNAPAAAATVAPAANTGGQPAVVGAGTPPPPPPGVVGAGSDLQSAPDSPPIKSTKVPSWQPVNYATCGLQFRGTVNLLDEASGTYEYRSSPFHTDGECPDRTKFQAMPVLFDQMAREFPIVDQAYNEEHDAAAAFVGKTSNQSIVNPVSGTERIVALNPDRFWSHCSPEPNARVIVVGELGGKQMYEYLIDGPPADSSYCKNGTIFRQGDELLRLPIMN